MEDDEYEVGSRYEVKERNEYFISLNRKFSLWTLVRAYILKKLL